MSAASKAFDAGARHPIFMTYFLPSTHGEAPPDLRFDRDLSLQFGRIIHMLSIKPVAAVWCLAAFLACTPNTRMTKVQLLACVEAQPDEYHVVQRYGVPRVIEALPGGPSYPSVSEPAYLWHYIAPHGAETTFAFSWDGRLILQSQYIPPSPTPR
jgi:hypothetical protein